MTDCGRRKVRMGKSILVIDTPECCDKCPLFSSAYTDMTCRGNGKGIDYPYPDDKVQEWCPLIEILKSDSIIVEELRQD